MSIELGSGSINKIYLGNTEIKKVYLGSDLIYDKTAAGGFLLDSYMNAVLAISNRQLKTGVTNVLRVRDSGDNSESDYTPAQITAGLTGIGSDSGFVTKGYDQSGVFGDLVQTVAERQMTILNSGSLEILNGKPSWNNGSDFGLKSPTTVSLSSHSEYWFFFVLDVKSVASTQMIFETTPNPISQDLSSLLFTQRAAWELNLTQNVGQSKFLEHKFTLPNTQKQRLITVRFRASQTYVNTFEAWCDGVSLTQTSSGTLSSIALSNDTVNLFARDGVSLPYTAKAQEFIMFSGDQSANRAGIEANINAYYNIY